MSEKRAMRRIFGPMSEVVTGEWRKLHNEDLHNFTIHQIWLKLQNQGGWEDGCRMQHAWEPWDMCTKLYPGNLKGRGHLEDLDISKHVI